MFLVPLVKSDHTVDPAGENRSLTLVAMARRRSGLMGMAHLVVTIVAASMATFSGLGKLRRDPKIVHIVHEVVGVPLKYFPHLAACEMAGALGLVLGIWWPYMGIAAGIGLVVYFVGAIVSHLRVADVKGIGPGAFMLIVSAAALVLRVLVHKTGTAG